MAADTSERGFLKENWISLILAAAAIASAAFALWSASAASRSAQAAKETAEDTRAPILYAVADFLRTPGFKVRDAVMIPDTLPLPIDRRVEQSNGRVHISMENYGDAVAANVRVRVPGSIYARRAGYATGQRIDFRRIEDRVYPVGDVPPGERLNIVIWLEGEYHLLDECDPGDGRCFEPDDIRIWADNESAEVEIGTNFRPSVLPDSAPEQE